MWTHGDAETMSLLPQSFLSLSKTASALVAKEKTSLMRLWD